MAKYSESNEPDKKVFREFISQRWFQLYNLDKDWAERALKYLLLTNAGGAIATMSFIGASKVRVQMGTKLALSLFLAGIIIVGILIAKTYHHMAGLFRNWKMDSDKYLKDKISWDELIEADKNRSQDSKADIFLAYLGGACFIAGVIFGICSLL